MRTRVPVAGDLREPATPEVFKDDIALNHATLELADQFKVKTFTQTEHPTSDQIAENKRKWGLDTYEKFAYQGEREHS